MKTLFPLVMCAILIGACKSKDEKLKEIVMPVLRDMVTKDSIVSKLDSIKIYKISNLTDLDYSKQQIHNLLSKSDNYIDLAKLYNAQGALQESAIKNELSEERLYAYLGSTTLVETQKQVVLQDAEKMKSIAEKSKVYLDSSKWCINEADRMQKIITEKKVDSTKARGYIVLYKILGADKKNMEVKLDSMRTFLSPVFRIIPINKI